MSQYESQFEEKFYNERRQKLEQIAALGAKSGQQFLEAVYPNHFHFSPPEITVPKIRAQYDAATAEQLEAQKPRFAFAGRIMALRLQGKAGFAQLQQDGARLQIYVRKDNVGDDGFELYKLLDLGDHIGVEGVLFRTRTNELTLQVEKLTFLAKAMLPLPDKYSGLEDIEKRYRQRYVDLFMNTGHTVGASPTKPVILNEAALPDAAQSKNPEGSSPTQTSADLSTAESEEALNVRATFVKRAAILRSIRKFFDDRGYLEVETPMLHTISGGAAARPFSTHHNALDIPLKLRIAPELYLKRLVVGGMDRVYEINRNFRNEGVSTQHNPEFTMLEFYQAYANYHDLMDLTEELIKFVATEVNGTTITSFPIPKGPRAGEIVEIELAKWQKLSMREAIIKFWPPDAGTAPTKQAFNSSSGLASILRAAIERLSHIIALTYSARLDFLRTFFKEMVRKLTADRLLGETKTDETPGKVIAEIFEFLSEANLVEPHIIYDFPLAVSPLSKVKPDEPDWVERFEFYIGGFEVGNAFSELNDPDDQLRRFQAQLEDRKRGDDEAMAEVDEDYVRALGYGLPPTAGEGIGIDRLTMILTGSRSIRDVILFPLMRPHTKSPASEITEESTHGESAE